MDGTDEKPKYIDGSCTIFLLGKESREIPTASVIFESYHPTQNAVPEYRHDYTGKSQTLMDGWFLCPLWYQLECFHFFQPAWTENAYIVRHTKFFLFSCIERKKNTRKKKSVKSSKSRKNEQNWNFVKTENLEHLYNRGKKTSCKIFLEVTYKD